MQHQLLFLWTDYLLYLLLIAVIFTAWRAQHKPHLRAAFKTIFSRRAGMITFIILMTYVSITLLDSIHFRINPTSATSAEIQQPVQSVLDRLLFSLASQSEKTYSKPFATTLFNKETLMTDQNKVVHDYPPLNYAGTHLSSNTQSVSLDILTKSATAILFGVIAALALHLLILSLLRLANGNSVCQNLRAILQNQTEIPWRCAFITITLICCLISITLYLSHYYHIFGTDKVGTDVFYEAIKSVRTGILIGTLTTLVMLPFALLMGTLAGYYGGKLDDIIQYLYTTLSSIPGVLLIAAAILSLQITISQHPDAFPTLTQRADARLLALCVILGVTSWTGLCRVLRAETLKVRELDFVQAARSMGASHARIMLKHILPNTMHIVIISVILDFSTLVLAEAVLSYIGIGVDPTTSSWGNMINAARLEMAREPVVWWPLLAAFVFMFTLVLSANIFSDAVRDGFDPRLSQ